MLKAVLDTNILISATFWIGQPYEITRLAAGKKIACFTSIEILDEYARILKRDFKQEPVQIEEKVKAIMLFSQMADPLVRINKIKEDPDDNKILEAAVEAKADFIVSGDGHLLKLKCYKGMRILTAKTAKEFLHSFYRK